MNKRQIFAISVGIMTLVTGIFAVGLFWLSPEQTPPKIPLPESPDLTGKNSRLSGPYTHKNLTVYLIHSGDRLKETPPLTLEEALKRKVVLVHETEDVNELAIENVSPKDEVYVQAGDIVKGGMQDRILAVDLIVPARSGRLPIDSFCVERGRWTTRGTEPSARFDSSAEYVSSKDMKVAARISKSQDQVWSQVEESQSKLSAATNSNTASSVSSSSLPLTLEHPRVRADADQYVKALSTIVEDAPDAIGFLFVVNGKINSADTYGSNALFLKLWTKLLKASAIEAVAESEGDDPKDIPGLEDIRMFLETSENAPIERRRSVTDRITLLTRETKTAIFLETLDRGTFLHGSYIAK